MILTPPGIISAYLNELPGVPALAPIVPRRELALANAGNNKRLRELKQLVFGPGTHTWPAPLTTLKLESLAGAGGSGTPYIDDTYYYDVDITTTEYAADGSVISSETQLNVGGSQDGIAPENSCSGLQRQDGTRRETCYSYDQYGDPSQSATFGASTTAFGLTFPGGYGGPATPVPVSANVHIKPGERYTIVVPTGGSVTISFYQ